MGEDIDVSTEAVEGHFGARLVYDMENETDWTGDVWGECPCGWWTDLSGDLGVTRRAVDAHRRGGAA